MRFYSSLAIAAALTGCMKMHPVDSTQPAASVPPANSSVATSDRGTVTTVPGLAPPPKPFIAVPKPLRSAGARPSTLLMEHASVDSPVPLSDYGNQPVHELSAFHLRSDLSANQLEQTLGPPAQLADNEDPWFVYRLAGSEELWLHFSGPARGRLDAADVIRGAENGYVRSRVFSDDSHQP